MNSHTREFLTVFLCCSPVFLIVGKLFFGSIGGFFDCVRFLFTPDFVSLIRGEWGEDQWATIKLAVYLALCSGALYSAHAYFYPQ